MGKTGYEGLDGRGGEGGYVHAYGRQGLKMCRLCNKLFGWGLVSGCSDARFSSCHNLHQRNVLFEPCNYGL
jgi:hypothetical protein